MIEDHDEQLSESDLNSSLETPAKRVRAVVPDLPAEKSPDAVRVAVVGCWSSIAVATISAVATVVVAWLGLLTPTAQPVAPPPPVINCVEYQRDALELQAEFPDRDYWQTGTVQEQCHINQLLNDGQETPP